jgi:5,10-methylenetetrahydromethanopterin reductase
MQFALDASPGEWAAAQRAGDRTAIRRAVTRTMQIARMADDAGAESIWCLEDPDGWDAFAVLGAIAQQTSRIRVGTGVTNPYYRHPALLAASTSTLDLLSGGRAFLGLGRGQAEWYRQALGIPVGKPVRALRETFDLLADWWSPTLRASSAQDASEFAVRDWERVIRPLDGGVPIYLAAVGPLALRLAGRRADGVIFNDLSSFDFMRTAITLVKESAAKAGRDPERLHFYARSSITITDDLEHLLEQRKATVAMIHALPGMEQLLASERYDIEQIIADVRRAMRTNEILERGGGFGDLRRGGDLMAAKRAIPTELMAELVVAGTIGDVRLKLAELGAMGVTHAFLARPADDVSTASLAALLQDLGDPVELRPAP